MVPAGTGISSLINWFDAATDAATKYGAAAVSITPFYYYNNFPPPSTFLSSFSAARRRKIIKNEDVSFWFKEAFGFE